MAQPTVLILGCGYTGRRIAERLVALGCPVLATTRSGAVPVEGVQALRLDWPGAADLNGVPGGVRVIHSVPLVERAGTLEDPTPGLVARLAPRVERVLYLSTTGVYGDTHDVDETTPVAPRSPREILRVSAEQVIQSAFGSSLILRPAAIYGPGRGAHVALRRGRFGLSHDRRYVSRIHVDDLAALATKGILSDVKGAYPVADELPCTSHEIASYCCSLLNIPFPAEVDDSELPATRRSNRRVDGSAIRRLLGIELQFPTYREGIADALRRE